MAPQVNRWHHARSADVPGVNVALRRLDQVLNDAVVYDDKATTFTQMVTFAAGVAFAGAVTFAAMVTINPGPLSVGVAPPSSGTVRVDGAVAISNNATNLAAAYGSTFALVGGGGSPNTGRLLFGDGTGWQFNFSKRTGGVTTDLFRFKDSGEMDMLAGSPYNIVLTGSPTGVLQIKLGDSSVFGVVGTRQSGGDVLLAANASQPTSNADFWVQSLGSQASTRIMLNSGGNIDFSGAGSGQASGTDATFWTLRARMTSAAFTPGAATGLSLGTLSLPWNGVYCVNNAGIQFVTTGGARQAGIEAAVAANIVDFFDAAGTGYLRAGNAALTPSSSGGLTLGTASLPWGVVHILESAGIYFESSGGTRRSGLLAQGADNMVFFDSGGTTRMSFVLAAASQIIPGATSLAVRDNANANDNLLVADAGTLAVRLSVNAVGGDYLRAGTRVVSTRVTGWSAWTGTADRTSKASDTSTLQDHGRALKALIDDLRAHGLIGT